jgi:hypothetical protein
MSEPDNFLARWTRRKQDVAQQESKVTPRAAEPPEPKPPAEVRPPFDPRDLPSVESITAATDLTPFMAPGVPIDIARAALRRAWSVDLRIRDFVGLSENAWDFNQPGAIGGFGALEMTDDVRRMVARIVGHAPAAETPAPATPGAAIKSMEGPRETSPSAGVLPVGTPDEKAGSAESSAVAGPDNAASQAALAGSRPEYFAAKQEPAELRVNQQVFRRGHGGALPK